MSRYLVEDWTAVKDVREANPCKEILGEPVLEIIDDDELFNLLQKEGDPTNCETNRRRIAVYKLPDTCVIDWS